MAQAVERDRDASSVTFEVERFEAQGRNRIVVSGRWYGLRGRRFARPMLTLGADESRQRVLADLEHRPWAAHDGELWEAAFSCERPIEDFGNIELTVTPDIMISLPVPGSDAGEQRVRARPRRDDLLDNLRGARRDGRPRSGSGSAADPRRAGRSATRWEDGSEARREAPRRPQAAPELAQALTRRDAGVNRLTEALSARDQALRARDEAVRARDQALRDRDRRAKERDQALRERDRAVAKVKKLSEAAATHRNAATAPMARSRAETSEMVMWTQRILAVSVLLIALLAFAITARLV